MSNRLLSSRRATLALALMIALQANAYAADETTPATDAAPAADASVKRLEAVSVIGQGETRQIQRIIQLKGNARSIVQRNEGDLRSSAQRLRSGIDLRVKRDRLHIDTRTRLLRPLLREPRQRKQHKCENPS